MSFWGRSKWLEANSANEIVDDFDQAYLVDGSYRLSIGDEIILSTDVGRDEQSFVRLSDADTIALRPGQFAYLITKETIRVPRKSIGFINVATSTKLKGLINISGFHVDPGYIGKLIFTVFNAGPTPIPLYGGQRVFRLWLSDIDMTDEPEEVESSTTYEHLPREWSVNLYGSFPSPFALSARLNEMENRLVTRAAEVDNKFTELQTKTLAQLDNLSTQRNQFVIAAAIIGLFLFPFVASLYASTFAPWFGINLNNVVLDAFFRK